MKNIYKPAIIKIQKIERHSDDVKLFRLARADGRKFPKKNGLVFVPGQFVLAGIWGYGESPFGPASSPYESGYIDIVVRRVGETTSALHRAKKGDLITLRGPYGNGYPIKFFEQKDILLITGGCGIPPIASLIEYVIKNRKKFGEVHLMYGATTPQGLLMKKKMPKWKRQKIDIMLTIDKPVCDWSGKVGFVTECVKELKNDPKKTVVAMCGPGPMISAIENILNPMGIPDRKIFVSMERKMQCGVGHCQHCVTGDKYVCHDGPVFNLDEVDRNWD